MVEEKHWKTTIHDFNACLHQRRQRFENCETGKDSRDANMRRDGLAPHPIAPIEVQGYVHEAKFHMASLLRIFGDTERGGAES
jgi:glycogen debranching enzyme